MRIRKKYKFQGGVQRVYNDTPDYGSAYKIRAEQNAKAQMGGNVATAAANIAMPGLGSAMQGMSMISDAALKDSKGNYKNKFSEIVSTGLNPMETAGQALSALTGDKTAAADLFSKVPITAGLQALGMKNPFGKTTQEKVKEEAIKQEEITKMANINKRYSEATATDAQAALAKKGKYKVKSKQPRLIETEGREPIFSPPDKNGKRKLLYYNPNDPTHEEGGVKAVVMPRRSKESLLPKAQGGKRTIKSQTDNNEDKESWFENIAEIIEPSGITSWGDAYRAIKSANNNPNKESIVNAAFESLGAIPILGKVKLIGKLGRSFKAGKFGSRTKNIVTDILGGKLSDEGFNYQKGTYGGRNIFPQFSKTFRDLPKQDKGKLTWEGKNYTKAYGAKQLKVNDLNNAALSQNFNGMPAANVANKFIQPTAGKLQVARQIPDERRKEKIRTPRSHKTVPVDSNRIIDPPMLYEMKPSPPRSTFNTKNDYKKGGSYIRTYQNGTEATATYKHGKTFKDRMAYQEALQAHDDSLKLYKQSRYFTNLVNKSNLYQPTIENPPVKNVVRTGKSTTSSPTKKFGAPDDRSENFITIAGINPVRKDLHSRKESKYKSFKEYEDAKAANPNQGIEEHEGYEINMYKHPEMAVNYAPDTLPLIKVREPKLKLSKDSTVIRTPKEVIIPNTKTPTKDKEEIVSNKPRGKYIAKEKTIFEKFGEKASQFFDKIGSSNRPVNGRKITVFK